MITHIVLGALVYQGLYKPNQDEASDVILILAKSEDQIDFSDLNSSNFTSELAEAKGVQGTYFKNEKYNVFISERVAPIKSYTQASKFMAELQRQPASMFENGSEAGKYFKEVFESVMPRTSSDAKPTEKNYAVALQVSFNTDTQSLKAPVSTPVGLKLSEVDRPLLRQEKAEDFTPYTSSKSRSFALQLSEFTKFNYVTKPLDNRKLMQEESVMASEIASTVLLEATRRVSQLYREYAQSHSTLLDRLTTQYANAFAEIPKEGSKFEDLPKSAQEMIRQSIRNFPGSYGFASQAEADAFIDSNPVFKVDFSVSLYEGFSKINPATGEPTRQGLFVNLGNP